MRIDVVTLFPGIFPGPLDHSILSKARESGRLEVHVHDLRDYAEGKHKVTDEPPYGGGGGMVLKPEPIFRAVEDLVCRFGPGKSILMSPHGARLSSGIARELSLESHLIFVCGRYEGVDQRVADNLVDMELSIGDYVLTGGELPALVAIDAISRFIPGVLGDPAAPYRDSFEDGLLEAPQYTRPADFRGLAVPDVLLSGDHGKIESWRREEAKRRTEVLRPDLLEKRRKTHGSGAGKGEVND